MNDHDVADAVIHDLTRLQEEFGFSFSDLLTTILRLPILAHWVMNDAILVASQHYNFIFLDKLLLSVKDVDVFDGLVDEPLLAGSPLVAIEILEVL